MSLLSLIGWLSHINGRNFYKKNIYPYAPKNKLKKIVSNYSKQNGGNLKNGKRKTKSIQQRQMARNGKRETAAGILTQREIDDACEIWVNDLDGKSKEEIADNNGASLRDEWFVEV